MESQDMRAEPGLGKVFGGSPAFVPRTSWGPWTALGVAVLIAALAGALSVVLVHAGLIGRQGVIPGDSIGVEVLMTWQAGVIVLTLLAALWQRRPAETLLLDRPPAGVSVYIVALALLLAFQAIATGLEYLFVPDQMFRDLRPFSDLARGPAWLIGLAVIAIGAPLSEELLFRGFLLPALAKSRIGFVGAALVSTTLWTTLHIGYTIFGLIEVFCIGLLFSWLLWRTGSLRVTILCHAVYNALILLVLRYVSLPGIPIGA